MPPAAPLPISADDLAVLRRWARANHLPAVLAQRAKILLLAADGAPDTQVADRVGVTRQTVRRARRAEILATTLNPPHHGWGSRTGRPGCWPPSSA